MTSRLRKLWRVIGWLGIGLLLLLSLMPAPPDIPGPLGWDKAQHTLAYAVLMSWFWQAYPPGWRWPLFFLLLGGGVELLQALSGYRSAELSDLLANVTGVGLGLGLAAMTPIGRILGWLEQALLTYSGNPP